MSELFITTVVVGGLFTSGVRACSRRTSCFPMYISWWDDVMMRLLTDAPWVITKEFLNKYQIDCVTHDALPYADASGVGKDVYEHIKSIGKLKATKRTKGISTSDIIMRMFKDYNEYVMRNLARGYTRKDLGVSYVKEKQLRVNMGITKLRQKFKEHQEWVGQKLHTVARMTRMHHSEWVENADRWVVGFLEMFEEGQIDRWHQHHRDAPDFNEGGYCGWLPRYFDGS
eukprot:Gb_06581 [translate_table: standard]